MLSSDWLTLELAVQKLGKSQATVERLVRAGALDSKLLKMKGRKPMRLYSAKSIAMLAAKPAGVPMLTGAVKAGTRLQSRREFTFSFPEGPITISMPAVLEARSVGDAQAFLELVGRQLKPVPGEDVEEGGK